MSRGLAIVGTCLLGLAAVSLVSARWADLGPGARLAILAGASAAAYAATVLVRRVAPETSRALDALLAVLVPADAAALAIVSGRRWPVALLAAGPAALVAVEILRRRDPTCVTVGGAAVGGIVTACGLAAVTPLSAPLLVVLAAGPTALGARLPDHRRAGLLATILAGLAPALRVLDEVTLTGMGTMRDLGLLDAPPTDQALAAGALAVAVLAVDAVRRGRAVPALAGLAAATATGIDLWARLDPPETTALIVAATVAALAELALAAEPVRQALGRVATRVDELVMVGLGLVTVIPVASVIAHLDEPIDQPRALAQTAAICAAGWIVADLRRGIAAGRRGRALLVRGTGWEPALPAVIASTAGAVVLATANPTTRGASLLALGLLAVTTTRPGRLSVGVASLCLAPLLGAGDAPSAIVTAMVATMAVAGVAGRLGRSDASAAQPIAACALLPLWTGALVAARYGWLGFGATLAGAGLARQVLPISMRELRRLLFATAIAGVLASAAADGWVSVALATAIAGLSLVDLSRTGDGDDLATAAIAGYVGWSIALATVGVGLPEPYLVPPLVVAAVILWRGPAPTGLAIAVFQVGLLLVTLPPRIVDGSRAHTLVLGTGSLALSAWGAMVERRDAVAVGGAMAVATAAHEALARAVGPTTWGWLVVGGIAALTAGGLLESRTRGGIAAPVS